MYIPVGSSFVHESVRYINSIRHFIQMRFEANPMAIHDHTDWMTAVEAELAQIAEYEDKLEALTKYFKA